jgi:hypothetical protein
MCYSLAVQPAWTPMGLGEVTLGQQQMLGVRVQESMRLKPVTTTGTGLVATRGLQLGNQVVPRGTDINIHFWTMFRDPAVWDRASDFLPVLHLFKLSLKSQLASKAFIPLFRMYDEFVYAESKTVWSSSRCCNFSLPVNG